MEVYGMAMFITVCFILLVFYLVMRENVEEGQDPIMNIIKSFKEQNNFFEEEEELEEPSALDILTKKDVSEWIEVEKTDPVARNLMSNEYHEAESRHKASSELDTESPQESILDKRVEMDTKVEIDYGIGEQQVTFDMDSYIESVFGKKDEAN